jgi:hypothetical protein
LRSPAIPDGEADALFQRLRVQLAPGTQRVAFF